MLTNGLFVCAGLILALAAFFVHEPDMGHDTMSVMLDYIPYDNIVQQQVFLAFMQQRGDVFIVCCG